VRSRALLQSERVSASGTPPDKRGLVVRLLVLHALIVPALLTGVTPIAVAVGVVSYVARVFGVTAGYHRLFSHHAYKTSRPFAFALAWLGASSGQRGPLWWAAVHRRHHRTSDTTEDIHSPRFHGLFFAHMGWILDKRHLQTRLEEVPDWAKYAELRWLDRFHLAAPASLIAALAALGAALAAYAPALGTSAAQLVAWGFVIATLAEIHVTSSVNSLAHSPRAWGASHPYDTGDDSQNLWWLAPFTLGESWHNNHHHLPGVARQGLRWWQFDPSYLVLRALAVIGVVWDLREPEPAKLAPASSQPADAPAT
jgi:stearoyl-CoA desaturase (delta-9 desaturase)